MKRLAIVAGALVGILAVVLFAYLQSGEETETPVTADAPASAEPVEQPDGAPAEPETATVAPSFDIVRVERSGETVIAGRAAPGAEVTVLDGEKVLGKVRANESGEWVFLPAEPLAPGSHELGLSVAPPGGATQSAEVAEPGAGSAAGELQSEQVVVVVVPEAAGGAGDQASAQPERAIAVLTPRGGQGVSKILQQPGDGLADQDLVLNAVDYDGTGAVIISGQATAGALIIVYLDNQVIGRVSADAEGAWQLKPEAPVTPGLHSLRVDRVDAKGKVIARVETPFSRSTVLTGLEDESFVVVQPGNSLWRIARRAYGEGPRYTVIYQANKSQIRDPDLIYPGQIFVVPPTD